MSGFFRRVAGAFVHLDEAKGATPAPTQKGQFDEITRETSALLAQLEGSTKGSAQSESSATPAHLPATDMTAERVFQGAGLLDGPNSAQRVLKLIAGLSMFPAAQQLVMVRAMDAADDAWSERDVLEDARRRQAALRAHLGAIDQERTQNLGEVGARLDRTHTDGRAILADIDRQLAELANRREEAVASHATATQSLEAEKQRIEESAEVARRGITRVIHALSDLMTFFTGGEPKPGARSSTG